jgi:S-adenosylmethionine synthetase
LDTEIVCGELTGVPAGQEEVEIVERKGLGHPDTICDLVADEVSQALCRAYRDRAGTILHHNCDKALLVAGQTVSRFGGGDVLRPMRLIIGDRASRAEGVEVGEVAVEAARAWFRRRLRHVDPDRHVVFQVELQPGSPELTGLFRARPVRGANDTSAAVGYAPATETERLVREAEAHLNSSAGKSRYPQTGEDVKVMGVRRARRLELTVAMPLLDRHLGGERDYFDVKEAVGEDLLGHLSALVEQVDDVRIHLNALDRRGAGLEGTYLTVLGTSAENADSGQVGRGNRANGVIALHRPSTMEAVAGKNPVSHVGKIYGVLAFRLAERLQAEVAAIEEAVVWLLSRIGERVDTPPLVSVKARLAAGARLPDIEGEVRRLVVEDLARVPVLCDELALGRHPVC